MNPPLLLIAGPTASGKSALALRAAERWGGEIVNADAIQLYSDLRILSARPSAKDEAQAPHHLFGVADARENWSVGHWLRAALPLIEDITGRGRLAIVVGGTGLYFRALTAGLAEIPPTPVGLRQTLAVRLDLEGEAGFRTALAERDPEAAARIYPGDRQRLLRAMAVAEHTGKSLTAWQAETRPPITVDVWRGVVIEPPRDRLYARCDARLDAMIEAGALDEVRALMDRNLGSDLPAMKAVGLRELAAYLSGQRSLAEAAALARQETRRYAKRQMTWLRNQFADWERVDADADLSRWPEWSPSAV